MSDGSENTKKVKRIKNANLNVKIPREDYLQLQKIADQIGGMTLSNLVRILIYERLEKVKKTGNPRDFLDFTK